MERQLDQFARESANFGFLYPHHRLLAVYGALAESVVFTDANSALTRGRQFAEVLTQELATRTGTRVRGGSLADRINALSANGVLAAWSRDRLDLLRTSGNAAVHANLFDRTRALNAVETCFELGDWFDRAVAPRREVRAFVPPAAPGFVGQREMAQLNMRLEELTAKLTEARQRRAQGQSELEAERRARTAVEAAVASEQRLNEQLRAQIEALSAQAEELRREQDARFERLRVHPDNQARMERAAIVARAGRPKPLSEPESRRRIDEMLRESGWVVQDADRINLVAGLGVAVREFRLATGAADYVLYVDRQIVGVLEAKREGETLSAAREQNERYADGVSAEYHPALWREDEPFAFRYASTGAETEFTNRLDPAPQSRRIFSFHRPETLQRWMDEAEDAPQAPTLRARIQAMPPMQQGRLYEAQLDAINGIEQSLRANHPRALVDMATGAGKTFTAVNQVYRLVRLAKAKRVLFLVDRANLATQARDEFLAFQPPDAGESFGREYGTEVLTKAGVREDMKVAIGTIQLVYSVLRGRKDPPSGRSTWFGAPEVEGEPGEEAYEESYRLPAPAQIEYCPTLPPESFDLIVVDECHRSIYGIWRGVLDYFDAPIVGLTATPNNAAMGFFDGNVVSCYPYERSVADGVNVDFDIIRISTRTTETGATIEAGNVVRVRDKRTRRERYLATEEDYTYSGQDLGRDVMGESQIRAVLKAFKDDCEQLFPGRATIPKTLIYAKSESHAEEIIKQIRNVFDNVSDEFAKKITYKVRQAGGNTDKLISEFRTSPLLRIAVTVDLISTGTDVRPIEALIFMRATKSPTLYKQMLGRGCRRIERTDLHAVTPGAPPSLAKERFVVFDAVGVTDSPVVERDNLAGLEAKPPALADLLERAAKQMLDEDGARMLAGRLSRLDQGLYPAERADLAKVAGGLTIAEIAAGIVDAVDVDAQYEARESGGPRAARRLILDALAPLADPDLREKIASLRRKHDIVNDHLTQDVLTRHEAIPRARRALEQRAQWHGDLEQINSDTIIQRILHGSGPRIALAELAALAGRIKNPQRAWTVDELWEIYVGLGDAVSDGDHRAALPDLITLIRFELGADSELRPYRTVIEERFANWLARQRQAGAEFTSDQLWWLESIRDVIAASLGVSIADLSSEPFAARGGTLAFLNAFGGKQRADHVIDELDRELAA